MAIGSSKRARDAAKFVGKTLLAGALAFGVYSGFKELKKTGDKQVRAEIVAQTPLTPEEIILHTSFNRDAKELYWRYGQGYSERDGEAVAFLVKTAFPAGIRFSEFDFLKQVHLHANSPKSELAAVVKKGLQGGTKARLEQLALLKNALSFIHEPRPANRRAMAVVRGIQASRGAGEFLLELDRLAGEARAARRQH